MYTKRAIGMFSLFSIYINDISAATKGPESKKPTGSQIIRICMGIYRNIDKTVKMYINRY